MDDLTQITADQLETLYALNIAMLVMVVLRLVGRAVLARLERNKPELTPEERDARRVARARATHK
ncbi:hypothetical protein KIF24_24215 [Micromonospora sp. Llam7]|uniref:hypothetical protein n=1 Tax=Micromonospora tarapacensis TaxID=2835305 RepID=UPI001C82A058|nr:hypothetical protein [Micromonospora tarapacensis]MBX7268818.1 hypothetical protein [Micromonospora tarapacensis]